MTTRLPKAEMEDIGALLDGSLEGEERARVLELLARDDASYDLFEESVLALEEERLDEECADDGEIGEDPAPAPGRSEAPAVVPIRKPEERSRREGTTPKARTFLALAAMVAAAAIGVNFWLAPGRAPSNALAASFTPDKLPDEGSLWPGQTRGGGPKDLFQAGRSTFAVAVLAKRGSRDALAGELERLAAHLDGGTVAQHVSAQVTSAQADLEAKKLSPQRVARRLAGWEKELAGSDELQLGRWCQAAVVAVAQKDDAFFARREVERLWQQVREAPAGPQDLIREVDQLLDAGISNPDQREELRRAVQRIINAFDPDFS